MSRSALENIPVLVKLKSNLQNHYQSQKKKIHTQRKKTQNNKLKAVDTPELVNLVNLVIKNLRFNFYFVVNVKLTSMLMSYINSTNYIIL